MGHGHTWTEFLDRSFRKVRRSVTRGIGPPRQSASFDIGEAFAALRDRSDDPVCLDGPLGVRNLVVCGSFWMMRELELSCALVKHIAVDALAKSVDWCLRVSKTDVKAVGKVRRWECVCGGLLNMPCPFHAVTDQFVVLKAFFGSDCDLSEMPFFPCKDGSFVEKRHVVSSIEHVAELLGEPLFDDRGVRRFGGHSLRVSGARTLAGMGIDLVLIQLMARWSSDVVLRYVADAPLTKISAAYRAGSAVVPLGSDLQELSAQLQVAQRCSASDARSIEYLQEEVTLLSAQVGKLASPTMHWVRNCDPGVVHRPIIWSLDVPPSMWCTGCGTQLHV